MTNQFCHGQRLPLTASKVFGGTRNEVALGICKDNINSSGGYCAVGFTNSNDLDVSGFHDTIFSGYHPDDVWVILVDSNLNLVWQRALGGSAFEEGLKVAQTPDGGFIIVGWTSSVDGDVANNHPGGPCWNNKCPDGWIIKLDPLGNLIWEQTLGGSLDDRFTSLQILPNGDIIVGGYTYSIDGDIIGRHGSNIYLADAWLACFSSTGIVKWNQCYGSPYGEERFVDLQLLNDGKLIAIGNANRNGDDVNGIHGNSRTDVWVVKLDTSGTIISQHCFGGNRFEEGKSIQPTADNGYIFTATTNTTGNGDLPNNMDTTSDIFWVVKCDLNNNIQWQKTYGGSNIEFEGQVMNYNNNYIIMTNTNSIDGIMAQNHNFSTDTWVAMIDSIGNIQNQGCYGGTGVEHCLGLVVNNNVITVAGYSEGSDSDVPNIIGGQDLWIFQLNTLINNIQGPDIPIVNIFPVPVKNTINIDFNKSIKCQVELLDQMGRLILRSSIVGMKASIPVTEIESGIYFLVMRGEFGTLTKKVLKIDE